jgi:hypothetical protein
MKTWTLGKKIAVGLVLVAAIAGASVGIGRFIGAAAADAMIVRLSVLWPDVMAMPQQDRALLAWLSINCNLLRQPENEGATVQCLRQAAATEAAGKAFEAPAAQLEHLLRQAHRAQGA